MTRLCTVSSSYAKGVHMDTFLFVVMGLVLVRVFLLLIAACRRLSREQRRALDAELRREENAVMTEVAIHEHNRTHGPRWLREELNPTTSSDSGPSAT